MKLSQNDGLTSKEASRRLAKDGYNEIKDTENKNIFRLIFEIIAEPMIFLLLMVVAVYFLLGDKIEAIVLSASVVGVIGLEFFQNRRTQNALAALKDLASPTCEVLRDGIRKTISTRELVVGDIVFLSEGSRMPADGILISQSNLAADESVLTGESLPVEKSILEGDDKKKIFSGTVATRGHGVMEVVAIGANTEIGKIGKSLSQVETEKTFLQKDINRVVKILAIFASMVSILLMILFWCLRGDLLRGFLAGLTLSIAVLPEEFPVVLSVFMALGAWRLSKNNVLSRRNQTIETLGSATVLCTDKTGTLTENSMKVMSITTPDCTEYTKGAEFDEIVKYGVLASQKHPFDPMEEAFILATNDVDAIYDNDEIIREYPHDDSFMSVVHVWGDKDGNIKDIAMKGAPEEVFGFCKIPSSKRKEYEVEIHKYAKDGLRVLAIAKGRNTNKIYENRDKYEYEFMGLVALADPIRREARQAVKTAVQAGIRVVMITGDYAETARRIGREIGIDCERVVTGSEFEEASEQERREIVKEVSIYSRVSPNAKLAIVNAMKQNGEIVAMTGDGVNDGPALKTAHIGIAMGKRGTDVAREASSLVLLDDNFASIVRGIRTGRRIFANLQKATAYIIAVHIPIILLSVVPVLFGWPMILLPIHIVFMEFLIDPSCTFVFESEKESSNIMKHPPRKLNSSLFNRRNVLTSIVEGIVMTAVVVIANSHMIYLGWSENKTRAVTFMMVILFNVALILALSGIKSIKEAFKNKITPLTLLIVLIPVILMIIYSTPFMRTLFRIEALRFNEVLGIIISSLFITIFIRIVRRFFVESKNS